jgi:hypothetical protein
MDKELVALFWVYGKGCAKHMAYRGNKPPTNCSRCLAVWNAKNHLDKVAPDLQEEGFAHDPRCFLCGTDVAHTAAEHVRSLAETKRGV